MSILKRWSKLMLIVAIPLLLQWAPTALYAQAGRPEILTCYGVGDEWLSSDGSENGALDPNGAETDFDYLSIIDRQTGNNMPIGPTGTRGIEAIAFKPSQDASTANVLYAVANEDNPDNVTSNTLGTINLESGAWTPISAGRQIGPAGTIFDIDALTYDLANNILWAVQRNSPSGEADYLLKIDPETGLLLENAFGAGVDWREIEIATDPIFVTEDEEPYDDIDDIAFHPQTGQLFAIMNKGGTGGGLVELAPADGSIIQYIGVFGPDDIEGLAFFNDGTLYGSSGNNGPDPDDNDRLFEININTGAARLIGAFPTGVQDIEALGCLTAPQPEYEFRKFVNGFDANDPDGDDTPQLLAGTPVTWTYWITNTGEVAIPLASLVVTDSDLDVDPTFNRVLVGNGDETLDPEEVVEYIATGVVPDPLTSINSSIIRNLCSTDSEDEREWGYKNIGTLTIDNSFTLTDPAHICIPIPITPSLDASRKHVYEFSYTVTNPAVEDGGVPLKNIKVQAASLAVSRIDCPKTTLDPNESMTCSARADDIAFRNSRGWVTADPVDSGSPIIRVVLPDLVSTH